MAVHPSWQSSTQNGHRIAKRRVASIAARQAGHVTWAQLRALGAAPGTITRWIAAGYLIPTLPRAYAVGHLAADERAQLFGLVLFAGPDAGQLDYERKLRPDAVRAACGSPWNGSAAMLAALDAYVPQLARTKSELEDEFIFVCQRHHIPLPKVNTYVHGIEVDCHWPELGLVVELDGGGNHSSGAQRHVDRRKEVKLRANGLTVVRYTEDQVFRTPAEVAADTLAQLEQRRGLA